MGIQSVIKREMSSRNLFIYCLLIKKLNFVAAIFCPWGMGSIPGVASYLVWDGGQWLDSVSSVRVDLVLNGYLEKPAEGKQEGCAKAHDGWPPALHCTSWLKGHETEISTAGLDFKGLVSSYLFTSLMMKFCLT